MSQQTGGISEETGRWVLVSCIFASSMAFINQSALNFALPAIQDDLGASGADLVWIINAYLIFLSALILVGGSLGDHLGRKRIFMIGIVIFSVASIACGFAPNVEMMIAFRAVQGVGGAMMVPGSLSIISALFGSAGRSKAIGTWSAATTITTALGPVVGGTLLAIGFWRGIFFINIPLAIVSLWALQTKVPESYDEEATQELDYLGAVLATVGLGAIAFGFIQAPERGWDDVLIILAFIVGVASLIAFVLNERYSSHPMMQLSLFKSRTFSGANIMTLFLYAALAGALFFLPLNLIQVQDYPELAAVFSLLPFTLLLAAMSRWAGGLLDRVGPRLPLTIGPGIVGIGFLALTLPGITDGAEDYFITFFPGIFIIGVGMGIVVAPLTATVMGSVSAHQSGVASGINNTVARAANVFMLAIVGAVALIAFDANLERETESIELSAEQREFLDDQASELAAAKAPDDISEEKADAIQDAIKVAFVDTFRLANTIAAVLCFISAGLAFLFLDKELVQVD